MAIYFDTLRDTYNELLEDVETAKSLDADKFSHAFIKRTYTRAFFALVEGIIAQLKVMAIQANQTSKVLSQSELDVLEEKDFYVNGKGELKYRQKKIGLCHNILYSFGSFARAFQVTFHSKTDDHKWEAMQKSIQIRDRITHPKNKDSLQITDSDMTDLGDANAWFRDHIVELLGLVREGL